MEKNKELLFYIIGNHEYPTITVLTKLCYLIDLVAIEKLGRKISNFEYVRYYYGPFDSTINRLIDELVDENYISYTQEYSFSGAECLVYRKNKDYNNFSFAEEELELIKGVLQELKGYGAKNLTEIAYKTKPMVNIGATLGGREGFGNKLDLFVK
jgi:hypothetical protein